jgi:protein gp37
VGENSKIEWTDHTFNPWIGCQHVSPGCDNCYAETMMDKRYGKVKWGPHGQRLRTSPANWCKPLQWDDAAQAAGFRHRVFCASLADWLDNQVQQQWRVDLAFLIADTPNLDWLLLTKRIENFAKLSPWPLPLHTGGQLPFPKNVWLGVTAEDQLHFDKRWPILQRIPASVRFVSYEPALGPLDARAALEFETDNNGPVYHDLHWIICGGESGHGARQMNAEWARAIRDQCAEVGAAFFMKQMTGKAPIPADLMVRQFPKAAA